MKRRLVELDVREAGDRSLAMSRPPKLKLPWHRAPSADMAVIYPWELEAGLGASGAELGVNVLAGGRSFCFDPFPAWHQDKLVTSPNMVIAGMLGKYKSTFVKMALHRWVGVFRNRACVIFDPKGEYGPLAEALGLDVIRLAPGGSTRICPLDPGPATGKDRAEQDRFRAEVIAGMQASVLGRPLTQIELSTVGWSIELMTDAHPTINDLAALWGDPTGELLAAARLDGDEFVAEMRDMRLALERLISGTLRGMFDGRSTVEPNWGGRGMVIDLSGIHLDPARLPLVMLMASAWIRQLFGDHTRDVHTYCVIDEAWAMLHDRYTASVLQANFKLARAYELSNIAIVHRIRDLAAQADDGTATAKIADGLLADAETRVIFAQPPGEIAYTRDKLGLRNGEAAMLDQLLPGRALWKIQQRSAVVEHRPTAAELRITDTEGRSAL